MSIPSFWNERNLGRSYISPEIFESIIKINTKRILVLAKNSFLYVKIWKTKKKYSYFKISRKPLLVSNNTSYLKYYILIVMLSW